MTKKTKLVAFDMDGTLLDGRVIFSLGNEFGYLDIIKKIMKDRIPPFEKADLIAQKLAGHNIEDLLNIIKKIPLMNGALETVSTLKKEGYILGIISDSYTLATNYFSTMLRMDFNFANELEIKHGQITGRLNMPFGWEKVNCTCKRAICKRYFLRYISNLNQIPVSNCIAVGDTKGDWCMVEEAGIGIAFNPKDNLVVKFADIVIQEKDLRLVLKRIEK